MGGSPGSGSAATCIGGFRLQAVEAGEQEGWGRLDREVQTGNQRSLSQHSVLGELSENSLEVYGQ